MPKTLDTFPIYNNKNLKRILKTLKLVLKTAKRTDMHTSLKTNMIKQRHKKSASYIRVSSTIVHYSTGDYLQLWIQANACSQGCKRYVVARDQDLCFWVRGRDVQDRDRDIFQHLTHKIGWSVHLLTGTLNNCNVLFYSVFPKFFLNFPCPPLFYFIIL